MFESREQRIAVIKTLFGAIGAPDWINDEGIQGRALEHYDKIQKGERVDLSHSGEWIFRLALGLWDQSVRIEFGRFYHLDSNNRRIAFGLLACFADFEKQNERIEAWLKQWERLRG